MAGGIDRRKLLAAGSSALLYPDKTRAESKKAERVASTISISRLEMSPEAVAQAVRDTVTSLEKGIVMIHGKKVDPRDSGYIYHEKLIKRYARGFNLPTSLSKEQREAKVRESFIERTRIFPISSEDMTKLEDDTPEHDRTATHIRSLADSVQTGEVAGVIYISADRGFQRLYTARKLDSTFLQFLESCPIATSKAEPRKPRRNDAVAATPLGIFIIPHGGVRLAFPGEVTKVERPDITRHYFEPEVINGKTRYFAKDVNQTGNDEIITVIGDSHLLWSPEIEGRGIKIHDTTELQHVGKSVSSGCIRTPSARRLTLLTANNRQPTKVLIHWARPTSSAEEGFGGWFGGEPIKKEPYRKKK